ncbi:phosphoesterase [Rhizocola hellebori]|uniref:Phosphoesterase n=1 Tax=Rhizocola hellebori TaxID=1392758 RepID=A0A8J3VKI2_9ACTN|nr:2'-5' RNA ligase family protein [Rhizocola hellebori]GIH09073.1 phosphoesterase [Rhizocola hellebori]
MERTIGVAIGVPQPWGAELDAHRASTGDPMAPLVPAHVTLLGPTALPISSKLDEEIDDLLEAAATGRDPFPIQLRGTGTFRPVSQVVFVALASGIVECEQLAEAVRFGPLRRELVHPYHPHVTVAHDVPAPAMDDIFQRLADYSATFEVDHFTRYEHSGDGRWRPIRSYKLGQG